MGLIEDDDRPAVMLYGGDFDASGEDILRNLREQLAETDVEIRHIGLTVEQIEEHKVPQRPGKPNDTRNKAFAKRYLELWRQYGGPFQIELDALPPDVLHELYQDEFESLWDEEAYEAALEREEVDLWDWHLDEDGRQETAW
jgi:hypothetical protein